LLTSNVWTASEFPGQAPLLLNSTWAELSGPAPGRVVSSPKSGVATIPVVLASIPGASVTH
jgi:hypothetical protein